MKVEKAASYRGPKGVVMTLGVFDGVHRGHQELISSTLKEAKKLNKKSLLYTFDPHPIQVLKPEKKMRRLFSIKYFTEILKDFSLDFLVIEKFSKKLSKLSPEEFWEKRVDSLFKPSVVIIGPHFRFGRARSGGVNELKKWQKQYGFKLKVLKSLFVGGKRASSSRLRQAFKAFDFKLMEKLMGRPFTFRGRVVRGRGRGASMGFATVNLRESPLFSGVYIGLIKVRGKNFKAVMNVGVCPTFKTPPKTKPHTEAHIIEPFSRSLLGENVEITILGRLRGEKKFKSPALLKSAVKADIKEAFRYFSLHF